MRANTGRQARHGNHWSRARQIHGKTRRWQASGLNIHYIILSFDLFSAGFSFHWDFQQGSQFDGADQSRRQEERVLVPVFPGCERDAGRRGAGRTVQQPIGPAFQKKAAPLAVVGLLLITDEPIGPEVGYSHFQFVVARLGCAGDINAEGRFPKDSQILAIEPNLGDLLNYSQVEQQRAIRGEAGRRNDDCFTICRRAGEILDSVLGVLRPGDQALESRLGGCAAAGREGQVPRAGYFHGLGKGFDGGDLFGARGGGENVADGGCGDEVKLSIVERQARRGRRQALEIFGQLQFLTFTEHG